MSYVFAEALQSAVYQQLTNASSVTEVVGDAIYDALPKGKVPDIYVILGPETVRDKSDSSGAGAEHRFLVSVVTDEAGFGKAKRVAGAVCEALEDADIALSRGRLVGLWFDRANARRAGQAGRLRRIDLRFRAQTEDN